MSQNLQNFAKFQNFQLDNLVDFEKCCKTTETAQHVRATDTLAANGQSDKS